MSSDFATVLDPEEIRARRRLFMTATPRYFTGRLLREAKDADYEIASMDDHTRFLNDRESTRNAVPDYSNGFDGTRLSS